MPFKEPSRYLEWNRTYQRARAAHANHTRVSLEEQIIHAVLEEPLQHDALSLYARLRGGGIPLPAITRAVRALCAGGLLVWSVQRSKNPARHTPGLALTDRARELFAPPAGRPDGDRADAHTEGAL